MPKHDPQFEKVLDHYYLSDSEDEYFSALEEQPETSVSSFFEKDAVRKRRTGAQRRAQAKLKQATVFEASNIYSRIPNDFPEPSDHTVSTMSLQKQEGPKAEKRWRSEMGVFVESSSSKRGGGESKSSKNKLSGVVEEKRWTVDEESAMTTFNVDGIAMKKYNEFKRSIINSGISPLDPRFESSPWNIKKTHQKDGFPLFSARLTLAHRVTFILNKEEHKVMIFSVKKHD